MLEFNIEKDRNYLLACSYSAASMTLLDALIEQNVKPIVCFVDYHNGPTTESDLASLRLYCEQHDCPIEVLDVKTDPNTVKDDYERWARDTRYDFFEKTYEKYNAAAMFIPHIQDDLIETYLLQKESGGKIKHYGFNEISTYGDMIVVRPLLRFSEEDIMGHVAEKRIPYSPEMTHFEDVQIHGEVRQRINNMNEVERDQLVEEISEANDQKITFFKHLENSVASGEELNIREIMALDEDEFAETLIHFVSQAPIAISLSAKTIKAIRSFCLSPQANGTYHLKGDIFLIKEYDTLLLGDDPSVLPYSYTMDKPGVLDAPSFHLDFSMGAEDRNVHPDDYPITIRTALPSDQYVMAQYLYSVRTLYHDWQMPLRLRKIWPVIVNKNGKVVYVPRYRHAFVEYHKSILTISVQEDEK